MSKLTKEDLLEHLQSLDDVVSLLLPLHNRLNLIIAGGGALVLMGVISRDTDDIDIMDASPELKGFLEEYGMNMKVNAYINSFPYNYNDRLVQLPIRGKSIDFYAISTEDIVISKLHTTRKTDFEDLHNPSLISSLNWDILERLATDENELKAASLNKFRYNEFFDAYQRYKSEVRG